MDNPVISETFTSRPMDDEQRGLFNEGNVRFSQLEAILLKLPSIRLRSVALTEIEKASLIVNKAISRMKDE